MPIRMNPGSAPLPESELIGLAQAGDGDAFATVLRHHDPRMRTVAYRILVDRYRMAAVLHAAYVEAFARIGSFRAGGDFGSWLYRIVYNTCIEGLATPAPTPLHRTQGSMGKISTASEAVGGALVALRLDERVAVVLVDGEGFEREVAEQILGMSPATLDEHLRSARAALGQALRSGDS